MGPDLFSVVCVFVQFLANYNLPGHQFYKITDCKIVLIFLIFYLEHCNFLIIAQKVVIVVEENHEGVDTVKTND